MTTLRVWRRIVLLAAVFAGAFVAGCHNGPLARSEPENKPANGKPEGEAAAAEKPRPKNKGRSPIEAMGLSSEAQEVERSLGAK